MFLCVFFRRVKIRCAPAELAGIAADHVQRDQPVETIIRRVLNALGHRRTGKLLKAHYELGGLVCRGFQQQQILQKVENGFQFRLVPVRPTGGFRDLMNILITHAASVRLNVGAINGEIRHQFDERLAKLCLCK